MDGGDGCTTKGMYLMPQNLTPKNGQESINYMLGMFHHNKNMKEEKTLLLVA